MSKYRVTIRYTNTAEVEVEADSAEEAADEAVYDYIDDFWGNAESTDVVCLDDPENIAGDEIEAE